MAGAEQNRAVLGLAILLGVFAGIVSGIALLPLLGSPLGFLATGAVGALPTFALMTPRIGGGGAAELPAAAHLPFPNAIQPNLSRDEILA